MKRYLYLTALISVLLLATYFGLNESVLDGYLHSKFPVLVGFFFVQSFPIGWILDQGRKDPQSFPMYAIGSIGFRMITGLFLLLFFYFIKTEDIVSLSIQFTGVYLLYLVFELTVVLSNLRRN